MKKTRWEMTSSVEVMCNRTTKLTNNFQMLAWVLLISMDPSFSYYFYYPRLFQWCSFALCICEGVCASVSVPAYWRVSMGAELLLSRQPCSELNIKADRDWLWRNRFSKFTSQTGARLKPLWNWDRNSNQDEKSHLAQQSFTGNTVVCYVCPAP